MLVCAIAKNRSAALDYVVCGELFLAENRPWSSGTKGVLTHSYAPHGSVFACRYALRRTLRW